MLILSLESSITSFGIWIVSGIYKIAAVAFQIFFILANGEIVSPESYSIILNNCYIILGIVMLFIIAFSLLKAMINPDDQKQGASAIKKIITNLITSVIILSLLPTLFSFAFDFQSSILTYNTFGAFFGFGATGDAPDNNIQTIEVQANQIVNSVFTAFFNINKDELGCDVSDESSLQKCQEKVLQDGSFTSQSQNLAVTINNVAQNGNFSAYAKFSKAVANDKVDFNFLVSLIGGIILLYVAVSYCFDMAVRLVKLVFYQLIAPIPVMFRIIPEGKLSGTFNQWMKITLTCYLEVFVRIIVLYFCIFLCQEILKSDFLNVSYWSYGFFPWLFTKAFILMGLITFMRQAPKLISEITGIDSGNMKLGIKDKLAAGGAFTAGAIAGGAITGLGRNAVNAVGNIRNNWKGATGRERAKMIAKGLGSTIAGTTSGGFNAGKAGVNAKSVADAKAAAIKGGATVDKNRVDRADRHKRYQATGNNKFTRSAVGGRIMDTLQGAEEYFSGGADKYSGIIKTADEMTGAYDSMEAQAKKLMEKFYNDGTIVARPASASDFKGDNAPELFNLYSKYGADASLSLIQSDLKKMESIDPSSLVNMNNYKRKNGKVDMFAYNQALEKARIDHSKKVANTREMLTQLEKKSVENIIQNAILHGNKGEDWTSSIKQSDLMGVLSAAREFESTFKSNGNNVVDPISGTSYSQAINLNDPNVQKYMDEIQKAYKNVGNQAKQQSADMRRKAAQRKSE